MASAIGEARLMPVSENDAISPGSFYFACLNLQRKTDPASYWIVLRAPREWLPEGFFDTRPVQTRVFPFWIVGKDQRVWLPRTSLFDLHRSQKEIFTDRASKLEFTNVLILIESFQNTDAALTHFKRRILDSTNRYNERREHIDRNVPGQEHNRSLSLFMDDRDVSDVSRSASRVHIRPSDTAMDVFGDDRGQQKRQCHRGASPNNQSILTETKLDVSSAPKNNKTPTQPKVKTEGEGHGLALANTIREHSRICIYVGRANQEFSADVSALERSSPVLHSLISSDDEGGRFIMHPKLRDIDADEFAAVLEFIQTGEYDPALVSNPDGNKVGPWGLDGKSTVDDYSEALVQASKLYLLAQMLQVKGMNELITRKVVRAQYREYSNLALIEFARVMFTRPVHQHQRVADQVNSAFVFEHLDKWAVDQLAENFMQIMRSEVEHNKYLEMIKATVERQIHAVILEKAASNYRRLGGLLEVIEDDD